jgi:phosphatidylinositol alpha-1,6-mannosyltransferase
VVIAAGGCPAAEAERAAGRPLPTTIVPPGVDTARFHPLTAAERDEARRRHGLPVDRPVVLGVSRLVPRKGFDTAIEAIKLVQERVPGVVLAIAGSGRDKARLERLATETGAPVRFLGRVANDELPALYGCADAFAMLCRNRWGGLEQEGFGIVFVEAASAGVAQVAGRSGGAHEAVEHGVTGFVIDEPTDARAVADALGTILTDDALRSAMAEASRTRAVTQFSYDVLAERLGRALGALP